MQRFFVLWVAVIQVTLFKVIDTSDQVSDQVHGIKFAISSEELLKNISNLTNEPISKVQLEKYSALANETKEVQQKILMFTRQAKKRKEILEDCLGLTNHTKNHKKYIEPLISLEMLQYTVP